MPILIKKKAKAIIVISVNIDLLGINKVIPQ